MATTYTPTSDRGMVRLLVNDIAAPWVFQDAEIDAFLALEGGSVKRAAAQAIDTNADNEALASKVLRTQDLQTDGAKIADALRKHAAALRDQADADDAVNDAFFDVVDLGARCPDPPERTQFPRGFW